MKSLPKPTASAEFKEAIETLKELNRTLSYEDIASMLTSTNLPAFLKTNPSTVLRWLKPPGQYRPATQRKIINAAAALKSYRRRPLELRCGVVSHAAEMLPIHLLGTLPSMEGKPEAKIPESEKAAIGSFVKHAGIKIEIVSMESIAKLKEALELGHLDMIAAPRHLEETLEKKYPVKRLFKISEVGVKMMLPIPADSTAREIIEALRSMKKSTEPDAYIGVLANGDYGHVLKEFLNDKEVPNIEMVSDSRDAFEKLKRREIQGVVGHSIMVRNTLAMVRHAMSSRSGERIPPLFKELNLVGESNLGTHTFGEVKMDVFVNVEQFISKPGLAGKVFHLVLDAIEEEIGRKNQSPAFQRDVNGLLGLDGIHIMGGKRQGNTIVGGVKIEGTKDAKHLFSKEYAKDYRFEIKTFVTGTLKDLWL